MEVGDERELVNQADQTKEQCGEEEVAAGSKLEKNERKEIEHGQRRERRTTPIQSSPPPIDGDAGWFYSELES